MISVYIGYVLTKCIFTIFTFRWPLSSSNSQYIKTLITVFSIPQNEFQFFVLYMIAFTLKITDYSFFRVLFFSNSFRQNCIEFKHLPFIAIGQHHKFQPILQNSVCFFLPQSENMNLQNHVGLVVKCHDWEEMAFLEKVKSYQQLSRLTK